METSKTEPKSPPKREKPLAHDPKPQDYYDRIKDKFAAEREQPLAISRRIRHSGCGHARQTIRRPRAGRQVRRRLRRMAENGGPAR